MIEYKLLEYLRAISSWYIILPLIIVAFRWKTHDTVRRWAAWYVIFNIILTAISTILYPNWYIFYISSPIFVWIVYQFFQPLIAKYKVWQYIKWLVIAYSVFAMLDMFFIEWGKFPKYIYPVQSLVILLMVYYFLYIFSIEARKDFSSLWISMGMGFSALIIFMVLVYFPSLGFKPNTFGYYIYMSMGAFSNIISYSCFSYGLYIAKPLKRQKR